MWNAFKYTMLHLAMPVWVFGWVVCAGAFAEGQLPWTVSLILLAGATMAIRGTWVEIQRMEFLAEQKKRTADIARRARVLAQAQTEQEDNVPQLRAV